MVERTLSAEALLGIETDSCLSPLALASSIEAGLPVSAIETLCETIAPEDKYFMFRLIPKATLARRRKPACRRFNAKESDRLARIAKVFSLALDIYRTPAKAREFLGQPHPMLDGRKPLDLALTSSAGTDIVIGLLGRGAYSGGV